MLDLALLIIGIFSFAFVNAVAVYFLVEWVFNLELRRDELKQRKTEKRRDEII